jgi:hypothetical protein
VLTLPVLLVMAVSMFVLGAGVVVLLLRHAQAGPVHGPLHVAIISPSHKDRLTGGQNIKLKVSSAPDIARVELTIDGKYWDRFKAPPFDSPWPTSLFANGHHVIVAKAIYRDRQEAITQLEVTTWNRP